MSQEKTWHSEKHPEKPYKDEELMEEMYWGEMMSMNDIRKELDCGLSTVGNWIRKHGFKRRTKRQACQARDGSYNKANYYTEQYGYEVWKEAEGKVHVHRLLAITEFGFDAVAGNVVHHKNGIQWDNRPENLEVMSKGEHVAHHSSKITGLDRLRVAELYENGDVGGRKIAEVIEHDVSMNPVMRCHKEFYGKEGEM